MNATLVLPELDANSFWHDDSGFQGLYDVKHFVNSLKNDVRIVESIPEIQKNGKSKKLKAFQIRPARDAPVGWYTTDALEKMREHGAIYLTPFSFCLDEEIDIPEYQRLRCRVDYHALRFKTHIMKLSNSIVSNLHTQGHFMTIHLYRSTSKEPSNGQLCLLINARTSQWFTRRTEVTLQLHVVRNSRLFLPKKIKPSPFGLLYLLYN